jgi:hypothetical protein
MHAQAIATTPDLAAWRRDGFVLLGRVLDERTLVGLRAEEAALRSRALPLGGDAPEPPNATIFRSQVLPYAPCCRDFAVHGPHLAALNTVIGPNVALFWSQFVTKLPDGDTARSVFPWHQDNGYGAIEPANNVTVWTALDDVDEENGCVWVIPGSHQRGLLPHRTASADSWHLTLDVAETGVPVRLRAGEAVAFSGLTLHRSLLNHTRNPRRAFFLEYVDANATTSRTDGPSRVCERPHAWVVSGQASLPARRS